VKDVLRFLGQYAKTPTVLGAVAPSSKYLARSMVEWIDWPTARHVVEFGPGTGAFTGAILERLAPQAQFFAIEINPRFAAVVRERHPQAEVIEDSVTNVVDICRKRNVDTVDAVLCGLPWASFSDVLQSEILAGLNAVLKPGGQFVTFAYTVGLALPAGRRFRDKLKESFSSVERSRTTMRNLPPAFVYRCRK
jgi:phospholipid N-methyltransferase